MKRSTFILIVLNFVTCQPFLARAEVTELKYWMGTEGRNAFDLDLLSLAMEVTRPEYGDYTIAQIEMPCGIIRGRRELEQGKKINVYAAPLRPKDIAKKEKIIPVLFPILYGLLGYRHFVVHKEDEALFDGIENEKQLQALRIGQVRNWLDIKIYQANGYNVLASGNYNQLFSMLERKRFDFIALGATEIDYAFTQHPQYESLKNSLSIYKKILIYYPYAVVFQVSATMPEIAKRIETGLKMLASSGEHYQLFYHHFGTIVTQLTQHNAQVFVLKNTYSYQDMGITSPKLVSIPEIH